MRRLLFYSFRRRRDSRVARLVAGPRMLLANDESSTRVELLLIDLRVFESLLDRQS
jgi:hypothetical protein